jgi:hypothetical protein
MSNNVYFSEELPLFITSIFKPLSFHLLSIRIHKISAVMWMSKNSSLSTRVEAGSFSFVVPHGGEKTVFLVPLRRLTVHRV